MAMNREQKRMMQKQGELDADGEQVRQRRQAPSQRAPEDRTSPGEFVREVRSELRKVAWPTRSDTINFSIIVIVTLAVLTAIIAGLDALFSDSILRLFEA